jgi:ABC-2 type transport system permease protein
MSMSTHTESVAFDATRRTFAPERRQTLSGVVRSEWIKLRTLRSTWFGLAAVLAILIGFGAVAAAVGGDPDGSRDSDPLSIVLMGADFAVLLVGILGALAGAREYGSGMISATMAAVPRRWPVVLAKAVVVVGVVLPTAVVGVFGAFGAGIAILSVGGHETLGLTDPGVLRTLFGMAGYVTAIALIGLSLGILLRSTASSIGALVAGVLLVPGLATALLPDSVDAFLQFLPTSAAGAFTKVGLAGDEVLGATAGAAVLLAWVVAMLAAGGVAIARRDVCAR